MGMKSDFKDEPAFITEGMEKWFKR